LIPIKAVFVIFVLVSGVVFSPSYSFAQSENNDNPLSSLFEIFRQMFSLNQNSDTVEEFGDAIVVHTSSTSSTESNIPPTANAGPDQEVLEFATVTLNGTSSTDVDGTITNYLWSQLSGANVTLSSPYDITPTFSAPSVNSQIILKFNLTVTDNSGDSSSDQVEITVNDSNDKDDNNNEEIEIEVEVNNNRTKIKVKIGEEEFKFNLPKELTDEQIIQFIIDEFGLDRSLVEEIIDIQRNGNNNDDDGERKVTVCHLPPGNQDNVHTLRIGASSLGAHLAHGDTVGECSNGNQNIKNTSGKDNKNEKSEDDNSGKGNSTKNNSNDKNAKSNSEDNDNSGKGNSTKNNSNDKNAKSNSEDNDNSGKGNSNKNNSNGNKKDD